MFDSVQRRADSFPHNDEQFLPRRTPSVIASDHALRGRAAICRVVSERLFSAVI